LLSGAAITAAPSGTHAQITAKQPLRILAPVPAGSTSDVAARLIADRLKDSTAQPVVVENRPGASGRVAVDALRSAAPDGTTVLLAGIVVPVIGPLVFKNLNYDPAKDLAPVSQVSRYEFGFAVGANHSARTVPEFVAWASANPARANVGNPGAGSLPHFVGVMIGRAAGVELEHIAYKGIAPLQAELMSGQVAAGIGLLSDWIALHRAGKLRILATSGAGRSPFLPEVPTFREQGYTAVEATGWHGVYAPAGTPQPVVDRLSTAIVKALQAPELREKLLNLGIEPTGTTPETLAAIMAADTARWGPIIKASGFSVE
jgi:tripartite-type tricarboxylate transporter receptor subunit TctC